MTDSRPSWASDDYSDAGDDGWEVEPSTPRNLQPKAAAFQVPSAATALEGIIISGDKESLRNVPPAEVPDHLGWIRPYRPNFIVNFEDVWRKRADVPLDVELQKYQQNLFGVRVLPLEYSWPGNIHAAASCVRLTHVLTDDNGASSFICVGAKHCFEDDRKGTSFNHIVVESDRQIFARRSADLRWQDEEHRVTKLSIGWPEGIQPKKVLGSPPEKPRRGQPQDQPAIASTREMYPDVAFFKVTFGPAETAWPLIEEGANSPGPRDWFPVPTSRVPSAGKYQDVDDPVGCIQFPGAYKASDFKSYHDVQDPAVAAAMAEAVRNTTHRVGYQGASAGVVSGNDGYHLKATYSSCHQSSGSPILRLKEATSLVGVHSAGRAYVHKGSSANIGTSVNHPAFAVGYVRHVVPVHMALHSTAQLKWPQPCMAATLREYLQYHREVLQEAGVWDTHAAPFLEQVQL